MSESAHDKSTPLPVTLNKFYSYKHKVTSISPSILSPFFSVQPQKEPKYPSKQIRIFVLLCSNSREFYKALDRNMNPNLSVTKTQGQGLAKFFLQTRNSLTQVITLIRITFYFKRKRLAIKLCCLHNCSKQRGFI